MPLQGPLRRPFASHHQRREARAEAGRRQGRDPSRSTSPRATTRRQGGSERPAGAPAAPPTTPPRRRRTRARSAYVGEFDSGATAISVPITNEASFVQVSPAATAVGLTKLVPGADKGEPDKYYPSGDRTFARVDPGRRRAGLGGARLGEAAGRAQGLPGRRQERRGAAASSTQFADAAERLGGHRGSSAARAWTRAQTTTATSPARSPRRIPTSSTSAAAWRATRVRFWRDLRGELPDVPADGRPAGC